MNSKPKETKLKKERVIVLNKETIYDILNAIADGLNQKEIVSLLVLHNRNIKSLRGLEMYISDLKKINNCTSLGQLMFKHGKGIKFKLKS